MTPTLQIIRIACDANSAVSDGELLRRYVDHRDEAAFAEVVRRHGPLVLRTCRMIVGESVADDAFQATFLVLARKAHRLTRPGSLAGWLHAAAVRIARAARRSTARARQHEQALGTVSAAAPDDRNWRDVREILDTELAALPERYRTPLILCCIQELSYAQAARQAACSVGALRGRLERAKQRLRRRLARHGLPLAAPLLVLGPPTAVSATLLDRVLSSVQAARNGGAIAPSVAALAGQSGWLRTAALIPTLMTIIALGAVAAVGLPSSDPPRIQPNMPPTAPAAPTAEPGPRTDLFGDVLPEGVVLRLGTIRSRALICGFGIAPDGTIITMSPTATVSIWPAGAEQPSDSVQLLAGVTRNPNGAVSPDGRYVAASSPERKVAVWERKGNRFEKVASFSIGQARLFHFSPDGTRLAAITGGVNLCDLSTGKSEVLEGPRSVEAIAFSGDGTKLAGTSGYEAVLWDVRNQETIAQYKTGRLRYTGIALDHKGEVLAVSPTWEPETVLFVDPKTGERNAKLSSPDHFRCHWASFVPDGKTVLLGDRTGVMWWNPVAGKVIRRFEGMAHTWSGGWNQPARFARRGKTLVGTSGSMLLRWDVATGKPLLPQIHNGGHHRDVTAIGVSRDGKLIATGSHDVKIKVWDAVTGRPIANLTTNWMLGLPNVEFSPDDRFVFAPSPAGGGITKWDVTTGRTVVSYRYSQKFPTRGDVIAFRASVSGRTIEAISGPISAGDPVVRARWDSDSGKLLFENSITIRSYPRLAAYSPDGHWLASGSQLYPIEIGPSGNTLPRDVASIRDPGTFSADSRLLVKVVHRQIDGKIAWRAIIFEAATGQRLVEFPLMGVARCAFHPDGRSVVVAHAAGLTYFDLITGKPFAEQPSPVNDPRRPNQSFANVLRYFPDGSKLITGHADTTALVWNVPARPESARALDAKERAAAWDDLISADGSKGWAAVWALADDPAVAAFLRDRIKPVEPLPAEEW